MGDLSFIGGSCGRGSDIEERELDIEAGHLHDSRRANAGFELFRDMDLTLRPAPVDRQ
jgi:hypothetical protein